MRILILIIFLVTNCAKNINILKNIDKNINEDLILATEEGRYFDISLLIEKGADVNYINKDNKSALEIAISRELIEVIKTLLENGAKVNKEESISKIYNLALNKSESIVEHKIIKLMKSKGYDLKDGAVDKDKHFLFLCCTSSVEEIKNFIQDKDINPSQIKSSLNNCLYSKRIDLAKFLIENYKMDLDFKDDYGGSSPFLIACEEGYIDIVNLMLDQNANVNDKNIYDGRTALHIACYKDNLELAKLLLDKGANLNETEKDGTTPLMYVACGSEKIVKLLLDYKADINIKSKYGSTALSNACSEGKLEIVKLLLNSNIDVNENASALVSASRKGNLEIIELLLERGFNLEAEDDKGFTPLMKALENNHLEVIELLLKKGANVKCKSKDEEEVTALMLAFESSTINVVKLMIEKGADVFEKSKGGISLIYHSSVNVNGEELIDFLLEKGLNIDDKDNNGYTALMLASFYGQSDAVNLLLKKGAKIDSENTNGFTPLMLAIQERKERIVKILLEKGASIETKNKYGSNPLKIAFKQLDKNMNIKFYKNININIIEMLIDKDANINQKDSNGFTELMIAAREGKENLASFLLENGASINEKDRYGDTALIISVQNGHLDLAELLLENGANPNDKNKYGGTPLMYAAKQGNKEIVKLLIEKGANVNDKNSNGNIALMELLGGGYRKVIARNKLGDVNSKESELNSSPKISHIEIADLLVRALSDINSKNNDGSTSLMFAAQDGHDKVVDLLIKNGADINVKDKQRKCALNYALDKNRIQTVELLLENFCEIGDNINLNNMLEELIVEKIKNKDIEKVLLLIMNYKNKINFNFKDNEHNNFLHYAVTAENYKLFNLFLENKLNINSFNENGETPLYCALSQEKINENFVCYLINKGAILGSKSLIKDKPLINILSPFNGVFNKLVCEPLIKKFLSLNPFKVGMEDKFKKIIKVIKLKEEDFIQEIPMINFLKDVLLESSIRINLNESDIKGDIDLDLNFFNLSLFDELFISYKSEDYPESVLNKGIEESKKIFKEILTKIVKAKPAVVESNLSKENQNNFKEFIAKKRLYKLIMLIRVLKGTSKNDQKIKVVLNDLLENLVCKNGSTEAIESALKNLSGKDIDLKEIIDEDLMNLRYQILKEIAIEEINKSNINVEIDGELYETALTPHLLSNLTLSIGDVIKVKPIYDQYNLKYKYNRDYISKEVLRRYEIEMINYLQNRISEDELLNDRIKDYIEKEIFKGRNILEVEDFIYDKEGEIGENILKGLLTRFKFFISNNPTSSFSFNFKHPSNFGFGPSTGFNFNFSK